MTEQFKNFLSFIFCVLAAGASAQGITIRSGAHDGFSRLVFRVPNESDWEMRQTDRGAELRISGYTGDFNLTQIFDFIDRRYIADVDAVEGGFNIFFSCDCQAEAFAVNGGFVAIDVTETLGQAPIVNATSFSSPSSVASLQFPSPLRTENVTRMSSSLELTRSQPETVELRIATNINATSQSANNINFDALSKPDASNGIVATSTLAAAQETLARQVSTAATRGILKSNLEFPIVPIIQQRAQIDTTVFDNDVASAYRSAEVGKGTRSNISVTNSASLKNSADFDNLSFNLLESQCPNENDIDLGSWGQELPPAHRLADLRSRLFTEANRLQNEIAIELAKLYLYYGFGAEAGQVLNLNEDNAQKHPELYEIAELMEFGKVIGGSNLANFAHCANPAALWAILSNDTLDQSASVNVNAALRTATALPIHLRRIIIPALSQRLLQLDDVVAASTSLRSLTRTPTPLDGQAELTQAHLQLSDGDVDSAQLTLRHVIQSNEQQSAEALIQLVETSLLKQGSIDGHVATLLEAYSVEMRDSHLAPKLQNMYALALAKSGQFNKAFDVLVRIEQHDNSAASADLRSSLIDITTQDAGNLTFLEHIFSHVQGKYEITSNAIIIKAAERLIALGFANIADNLLKAQKKLQDTERVRELQAEIALELERPLEAEALLESIDTGSAQVLKAAAKSQLADFSAASELFAELGDQPSSIRTALLAGNWESVSLSSDETLAKIADLLSAKVEDSGELDGILARLTDTIDETRLSRSVIDELLTELTEDAQ